MKISRGGKIALPQGEKSSEKIEISAIEETEEYYRLRQENIHNG